MIGTFVKCDCKSRSSSPPSKKSEASSNTSLEGEEFSKNCKKFPDPILKRQIYHRWLVSPHRPRRFPPFRRQRRCRGSLGSYTRQSAHEKEHFHFSLLFVAYGVNNPLSKEDRIDLFKHEYAHYMQYNMRIPEKYKWQAGTHGSAWKYCCSLIGAAPTPYYKAGEALLDHNYDKVLKSRIHDKTAPANSLLPA